MRERRFECTLGAGGVETAVSVSAWDARSAEDLFREALLASGMHLAGTIRVRDPKGRLVRETRLESRECAPAVER